MRIKLENIIDVFSLLPEEIVEAIEKLSQALEIIKVRKNTIFKVAERETNTKSCPCCQSKSIVKNGHDKNKVQLYKCKDCNKKFSVSANSFISHVKLSYEQIEIFFECMDNKLSIRKTQPKCK